MKQKNESQVSQNTAQMNTQRNTQMNSQVNPTEEGVKINGLQQVIDMLKLADPAFRESLLRRLSQRDPDLTQNIRKIIR